MLDITSADSIIEFAKQLKNQTLRQACGSEIEKHGYKGKGNFGQILEKFYFGYEPNSDAEPDFLEAGLELKTSPLKTLKNGEYRSKERLVLNIINYLEVHKEEFETSSFWKKNAHLLLVYYLHDRDLDLLDYIIKLVEGWQYPNEDLKIIKQDWELINQKIKDGKAHELSEGDTFYLGACTKGSTALKSFRDQPFNKEQAKQRAYSLKQGYVNHIIANIARDETAVYGKLIEEPEILDKVQSIEDVVISKFKPLIGMSDIKLVEKFGLNDINKKAKNYHSKVSKEIVKAVFKVPKEINKIEEYIEEFHKSDLIIKTVRIKENNLPKEDISFPTFEYQELIESDWEDSDFKNILESKFFFVFYQYEREDLILRKVKFWNMPSSDIPEAKNVWKKMVKTVSNGEIVKEVTKKGDRKTYFPKKTENRVSHVRPHARNKADTYALPVADKLTGLTEYTKHCFWLNASYVRDQIYLK